MCANAIDNSNIHWEKATSAVCTQKSKIGRNLSLMLRAWTKKKKTVFIRSAFLPVTTNCNIKKNTEELNKTQFQRETRIFLDLWGLIRSDRRGGGKRQQRGPPFEPPPLSHGSTSFFGLEREGGGASLHLLHTRIFFLQPVEEKRRKRNSPSCPKPRRRIFPWIPLSASSSFLPHPSPPKYKSCRRKKEGRKKSLFCSDRSRRRRRRSRK